MARMTGIRPGSLLPGAAVAVFGLFVGAIALSYPLGSAFRPGPGFFPLCVAILLVFLGVCVAAEQVLTGDDSVAVDPDGFTLRPMVATSVAILVFALTLDRVGYVPAAVLLVLIAAFGERRHNWWLVLGIAAFMAVFGTLVFIWGLGLPIEPFMGI